MNNKNICDMKVGDNVLISPDLTHQTDWVKGKVIDVEQNQFVGVVISAETSDGDIFLWGTRIYLRLPKYVCTKF